MAYFDPTADKPTRIGQVAGDLFAAFIILSVIIVFISSGLTDFLYQRDGETIAFARPDLAVSGTGSSSVAPVVDIPALSAA